MITDHGAITTNVVSLVYIHLEDFLEVLKMHHADHEKYTLIKDNFNLYSSSRGLGKTQRERHKIKLLSQSN